MDNQRQRAPEWFRVLTDCFSIRPRGCKPLRPGPLKELQEKASNVMRVDLIPNLLAVITMYCVGLPQDGAAHDVGQYP